MNSNSQPISAERAAALLADLVPGVARVELWPYWTDGDGGEGHRWTGATPYDGEGRIVDLEPEVRREVCAVLRRLGDVDLDRPQWLSVPSGAVEPVFPVVSSLPVALWESPVAADPYRAAQLDVQRHELEDAVVPPLAVGTAADFAASVAAGYVEPVVWGDCDPATAPERPVVDVPVVGEAL